MLPDRREGKECLLKGDSSPALAGLRAVSGVLVCSSGPEGNGFPLGSGEIWWNDKTGE